MDIFFIVLFYFFKLVLISESVYTQYLHEAAHKRWKGFFFFLNNNLVELKE